ncbi:MAG TPA: cytochrome c biogenesis protein CcsA [Chthoniobacteraceae bacterium]|nr:cytochrome c biogenesis protein CcsA [Chthoniobacteraceae bacterium]
MDRLLLVASTFCFLFGFAYTMYALGARTYRPSRFNYSVILLGFVLQTGFLTMRGHAEGRCPLTNLFEVFVFLSWSVVLLYLLIGSTYRMSLMGLFTSPLVFLLQAFALLGLPDAQQQASGLVVKPPDPWLEMHASISIIAYGAFAMAGVAGVMYLAQERQLKTHNLHTIFYHLPPIADLAVSIHRLLLAGFILLTAGLLTGFMVGFDALQVFWGIGVWVIYGVIIQAEKLKKITPRRVAILSVVAFSLTLSTFWGLKFL